MGFLDFNLLRKALLPRDIDSFDLISSNLYVDRVETRALLILVPGLLDKHVTTQHNQLSKNPD